MEQFKIETSFPFPILKVGSLVTYTKVEKPSGISFIILVLINEPQFKNQKLSDLLVQFGVPVDLHSVFADEVQRLINELAIIECVYTYGSNLFSEYKLGDFFFTEKGKKIFKDEMIPSDLPIEGQFHVYFNPAKNELFFDTKELKLANLDSSALSKSFAAQFDYKNESELEDYLNSIKGIGIKIKKEELITKVSLMDQEYFYTKYDGTLVFKPVKGTLDFLFDNKALNTFYNQYFTPKIIQESLCLKNKFKAKGVVNSIYSIDKENITYKTIDTYDEILSKKTGVVITKGNYQPTSGTLTITEKTIVDSFDKSTETIHFFDSNTVVGYAPVNTTWNLEKIPGTIQLPLLIEQSLTPAEINTLLEALPSKSSNYSIAYVRTLISLLTMMGKVPLLEEKLAGLLESPLTERIKRLEEIKNTQVMTSIKPWMTIQVQICFDEYFTNIPLDSLSSFLNNGQWMIRFLGTPQSILIRKIIDSNPKALKEELLMSLESNGFSVKDILREINIMEPLMNAVLQNNPLPIKGPFGQTLESLRQSLSGLKTLTGIKNSTEVLIKENLDTTVFIATYSGFKKLKEELANFRNYAPNEFVILDQYGVNFNYIHDAIREGQKAESNPKDINKKNILEKIQKREFLSAMVFMGVKLEWIFLKQYLLNGTLESSIDQLRDDKILSRFVKDLHEFRIMRNQFVHPGSKVPDPTLEQLQRWVNIIFEEVNKK